MTLKIFLINEGIAQTILLVFVSSLMMLVIYLATHYTRQSATKSLPYHFTIPILSPFTSVVRWPASFSLNDRNLVCHSSGRARNFGHWHQDCDHDRAGACGFGIFVYSAPVLAKHWLNCQRTCHLIDRRVVMDGHIRRTFSW